MRRLIGAGVRRGVIELRQTVTNVADVIGYLFAPVMLIGWLQVIKGDEVPGSTVSLGAYSLVSSLALLLVISGVTSTAQYLTMDREDGTLLRAKATPNGMIGYLIGKIVLVAGVMVLTCVVTLLPGSFLVEGLRFDGGTWLTLLWLLPLSMLALMPAGAILGSFFETARGAAILMLPVLGLTAISGIFYAHSVQPGWLQGVSQVFPMYWLGSGLRSAFLPGEPERQLATAGVLAIWAVLGLGLAPRILRRMARRESGSLVAARRERAMSRTI
ncbi:ABC transporter permease [Actinoplanes sp. NEAU-A12]|uniref:ABC transporter permease n=1 Tax=Actinoplanes sandaracinus TaxID=3045177 RepID=A0ABT6WD97_9ACTN|nr:ABC transporter permease [Actinoplanes sandaracinus]MDI6097708.1 ABC transporter permease [Actinoplanes sandaracinus]